MACKKTWCCHDQEDITGTPTQPAEPAKYPSVVIVRRHEKDTLIFIGDSLKWVQESKGGTHYGDLLDTLGVPKKFFMMYRSHESYERSMRTWGPATNLSDLKIDPSGLR